MSEGMNIFVSCGEPSGDVYAGDLIRELRAKKCSVSGMLGPKGVSAGGEAKWGYEALHLMGIVEVIPAIPRLLKLRNEISSDIARTAPDCVVVIDSPDFHLPLIKKIRKDGYKGKIIYLVTPTVWAWRSGRAATLRECCDLCLPLFSFENEWLVQRGINSAWKVHPLVEKHTVLDHLQINGERYRASNARPYNSRICTPVGATTGRPLRRIIAFMPGSRSYDINWHIDALLESAGIMRETSSFAPVFSIAPGLYGDLRKKLIDKVTENNFEFCECEGRELLSACEAAVGVSGTISVEAMLLSRFMVVVYNGNFVSKLVWKTMIHTPYISIPNMLTSEQIFPELLSSKMTPQNIVRELKNYLENDEKRREVDALISEAVAKMGQGNAARFWAEKILELLK